MTESRHRVFLAAGLIVLAAIAAYANSLRAPFIFDDEPAIVENLSIRHLSPLSDVLLPPARAGSAAGRPLVNLSFALNYAADGLNPRGYHLANLFLHALAGLVLFGILRRTFLQPAFQRPEQNAFALATATAIAAIWVAHPLQTESVTCAVHRAEVLGGLFYLCTVYAAIRALEPDRARTWNLVSAAACLAGVASKETVATAPLIVVAYDWIFGPRDFRSCWRQRWPLYLSLALAWLPLGWLMASSDHRAGAAGFGLGVSAGEYFLTQAQAVAHYLRLAFWPEPLVLDYGTATVKGLRAVLIPALGLSLLAIGTIFAAIRRRPVAFAGLWFFAILAPSSSFVPLITQTMAEHRMYLSLAAVIAVVLVTLSPRLSRGAWTAGVLGVWIALGILTVRRNAQYQSAVRIWSDTVTKVPANSRAHAHLAQAFAAANRWDEALAEYRASLLLLPNAGIAYNVGLIYLQRGQIPEAAAALGQAVKLDPLYPGAQSNLGTALLQLGQIPEAIQCFESALRAQPDYAPARYNLANLLARTGRLAEAIPHFAAAAKLAPERADALRHLADALFDAGRTAEAIPHYEKLLKIFPQDPEIARNLAEARQAAAAAAAKPAP